MPLQIVRDDIVRMRVDAVVNAANQWLQMGGGVCGAIFRAAGERELQRACDKIGRCPTGQAVITDGFALPAKYIIHAVGPIWRGGGQGEAALLRGCYTGSMELAVERGCESIAFPLIATGIYGYPKEKALRIAAESIETFLADHELLVYLVVYDRQSLAMGEERFRDIRRYIDDRYVEQATPRGPRYAPAAERLELESAAYEPVPAAARRQRSLEDAVSRLDESFSQRLLRLIDERGRGDVEVYKRANVDRKLFSKIRSNPAYNPSKATAIAFAVALELSLDETRDLLARAGYALSPSSRFDVIIEYFIEHGVYNIFTINEALFAFDEMLLGA